MYATSCNNRYDTTNGIVTFMLLLNLLSVRLAIHIGRIPLVSGFCVTWFGRSIFISFFTQNNYLNNLFALYKVAVGDMVY